MKTYNHQYSNKEQFISFLEDLHLPSTHKLLVQIYCGVPEREYIQSLIDMVKESLPGVSIIGSTSGGEILDGNSMTGESIISITQFENTRVRTVYQDVEAADVSDMARKTAQEVVTDQTKVLIAFASGFIAYSGNILKGLDEGSGGVIVAGGVAANSKMLSFEDSSAFQRTVDISERIINTYVFTEEGISNSAIVLAALDGEHLHVSTDSSFNWIPIGREYTVTKAEGNTIFEIEGIPAKELI